MTERNRPGARPPAQHVIASPNPTIDDSKTPAKAGPVEPSATKVQPAKSTTAAPLKATTRPKPGRRRPARRND